MRFPYAWAPVWTDDDAFKTHCQTLQLWKPSLFLHNRQKTPEISSCFSLTTAFSCQQQPCFPPEAVLSSFYFFFYQHLSPFLLKKIPYFFGKWMVGIFPQYSPLTIPKQTLLAIAVPWPSHTFFHWPSALPAPLQCLDNCLNVFKSTLNSRFH